MKGKGEGYSNWIELMSNSCTFDEIKFIQDMDERKITSPKSLSKNLREFCEVILGSKPPYFLNVNPFPWSRLDCCDMNVNKAVTDAGGSAVLGYKIWAIEDYYFEAVKHCIWKTGKNELRDVTFNSDGEKVIVFSEADDLTTVRDDQESGRVCWSPKPSLQVILDRKREYEATVDYTRLPDEELWATTINYKRWKIDRKKRR